MLGLKRLLPRLTGRRRSPTAPAPQPEDGVARLIREFRRGKDGWLRIGTPWFTRDCVAWLDTAIRPEDRVLEFGGGRSTIYWAERAAKVTCVEASPDWSIWLMLHLYDRPALLKKLRLHHVPAEWNPSFEKGLRRYWRENRDAIDETDRDRLETDLALGDFGPHEVLVLDGGLRRPVMVAQLSRADFGTVAMVIVDNTEHPFNSLALDHLVPPGFHRIDFPARADEDVAPHQDGRHVTTVMIRADRADGLAIPAPLSPAERAAYFTSPDPGPARMRRWIHRVAAQIAERSGTPFAARLFPPRG